MEKSKDLSQIKKGVIDTQLKQKELIKEVEGLWGIKVQEVKPTATVYLVIDCSGSMADGNKMEQARNGAIDYAKLALRKGYSIGLIKFSNSAVHLLEPQNRIENFIARVGEFTANGSTNMADAISLATDNLIKRKGEKVMCIVTDGMPDDEKAALACANEAKRKGIDIMTIGTDDADREFLEKLATCKELAHKVIREQLGHGIASMAKMLPDKTKGR